MSAGLSLRRGLKRVSIDSIINGEHSGDGLGGHRARPPASTVACESLCQLIVLELADAHVQFRAISLCQSAMRFFILTADVLPSVCHFLPFHAMPVRCAEGSLPDLYDRLLRFEYCPKLLLKWEIDDSNGHKHAAAAVAAAAAAAASKQYQQMLTGSSSESGSDSSGEESEESSEGTDEDEDEDEDGSESESESDSDSFAGFASGVAAQSTKMISINDATPELIRRALSATLTDAIVSKRSSRPFTTAKEAIKRLKYFHGTKVNKRE
jgi:hypothetical protein